MVKGRDNSTVEVGLVIRNGFRDNFNISGQRPRPSEEKVQGDAKEGQQLWLFKTRVNFRQNDVFYILFSTIFLKRNNYDQYITAAMIIQMKKNIDNISHIRSADLFPNSS